MSDRLSVDSLRNALSKLGAGQGNKTDATEVGSRTILTGQQLDVLHQHALMNRITDELPSDAGGELTIGADRYASELADELTRLGAASALARAGGLARHYGGALVWMITERAEDLSKPLESSEGRVLRLEVLGSQEVQASVEKVRDPREANYGKPEHYMLYGGATTRLHHSRVLRLEAPPPPAHLRGETGGWGEPVPWRVWRQYSRVWMGAEASGELLQEFGGGTFELPNMTELLKRNGEQDLGRFLMLQRLAYSTLRSFVLGPGQRFVRNAIPLSGYPETYQTHLLLLAAEAGMPLTKLYGQVPSGMATDDASGWRNWEARVGAYRSERLLPALRQLIEVISMLKDGPTRGQQPERVRLELPPYNPPSPKEREEVSKMRVEKVLSAHKEGVMTREEARRALVDEPGMVFDLDTTR